MQSSEQIRRPALRLEQSRGRVLYTFSIDGKEPCHLPLLLSENSYTTYRGS